MLVSPRVNVEPHPSYSVFSTLRYTEASASRRVRYLSLQALNTFDADRHIKGYQRLRLGLDVRGTQCGLGVNLNEYGPSSRVETGVGVFVRRQLF